MRSPYRGNLIRRRVVDHLNVGRCGVMKRFLSAIAAGFASFAPCIAAQAADLATGPVYKAPIVAQQVYNWTGFYVGVNGGYGWGNQDPFNLLTNRFDAFSVPFSGGMVGGTFGGQIQSGHVVLGVEADIDWASVNGSATVFPTIGGIPIAAGTASLSTNIHDVSTGRLRVGYALDNWLLYATAGLALLGAHTNVSTVGGLACTTAKFEYMYITAVSLELSHVNEVRAGMNFRFGGL